MFLNVHVVQHGKHLGRQLPLHILDLSPEHEGLQDLMQPVYDHHTLLHGHIILTARCILAKAVPEPLRKLILVIKHLKADKVDQFASALSVVYSEAACQG